MHINSGKTIVPIDESGFAHDSPRTHGVSPVGQRCYGKQDWGARGRTNVIGALIGKKLLTVCLFECNINTDIFTIWVKQDLLAKLPDNSVIVMDNAAFHKGALMKKAVEDAGHIIEYLPPYSPDLNPIEKKWAHAKSMRRKYRCSVDELFSMYMT